MARTLDMRRTTTIALCLAAVTVFSACIGGVSKKQVAGITAETDAAEEDIDAVAAQEEARSAEQTMPDALQPQEKIDWLAGDFKIELDEVPEGVLHSLFGAPAADAAPARKVAVKSGNRLYYSTTEDGSLKHIVFRLEEEKVVSYLLAPEARRALRTVSGWESLEAILRSELGGSVWSEPKKTAKLTAAGSESVAGVECEIYTMSIGLGEDYDATANAMNALVGMLGGEKVTTPLDDTEGLATMWIDPTRSKFVARRHIRMKVNGRRSDRTTHNVIFFAPGNAYENEIPDLSTYTID